jgi:putative phosphoribosyl transferase
VHEVVVRSCDVDLGGLIGLPEEPSGLVLFAHGSGSSRFSPRNNAVAAVIRESGLGTLLFDLLTDAESADRRNVFDIELLADRLIGATEWARSASEMGELPIGYFGSSTGAAAALVAAAREGARIEAVVSRGGRPDLAMPVLSRVTAPTLLIVGGYDVQVLDLNRQALEQLGCDKDLTVVDGATHLFQEPGALERVSSLAAGWFADHVPESQADR